MVGDGAFSHIIDSIAIFLEILNLKGHPNCITFLCFIALLVQEFLANLLNGWILPIGGALVVEGLQSMGLPLCFLR